MLDVDFRLVRIRFRPMLETPESPGNTEETPTETAGVIDAGAGQAVEQLVMLDADQVSTQPGARHRPDQGSCLSPW